ncbi:MAG: hypothetical protein IT368_06645 [Candidatus Hydrogenedentes bacterium]|nr:hypothetical protein [Candidatus Hydrogenedentota bacterium]
MSEKEPRFPEYGLGGDYAGARRGRRAFRLTVVTWVLFVTVLWVLDWYAKYDLLETQYRIALTHEPNSARAVLRHVVKSDREAHELPTVKYLEALAEREEEDMILPLYAEAVKLDPKNSFLLIQYGCRLFAVGQYKQARELFREASVQPPKNALPRYLEAAAVAAGATEDGDLSEAVSLLARANSRDEPLLFPEPLWHPSLPEQGEWYARLQRERMDLCLQPLYVFHDILMAAANADLREQKWQDWDAWLGWFGDMGRRVLGSPNSNPGSLGAVAAMAGVTFQLSALQLQQHMSASRTGASDPEVEKRIDQLRSALEELRAFENGREPAIRASATVVWAPLKLAAGTAALLIGLYIFVYLLAKVVRAGRAGWSIGHPLWAKAALAISCGVFFVLLLGLTRIQQADHPGLDTVHFIFGIWYCAAALAVAIGICYPFLSLPRPIVAVRNAGLPVDDYRMMGRARRARRIAAVSMLRRYFGMLAGSFVGTVLLWAVLFRMDRGVYPLQTDLLVTGLRSEELLLVRQIQEMLL